MSDYLRTIRRQQLNLSRGLAKQLLSELKPYINNAKFNALEDYVKDNIMDLNKESNENIDLGALESLIKSDLERDSLCSIRGYTEWLLCRMVHSNDYSVPSPNEIDWTAIENKYDVAPMVLRRAASFMHSKGHLPLLGTITKGQFCPDKEDIALWKSQYNWNLK